MKRRDFIKSSLVLSAMGSRIPLLAINRTQKQMARTVSWESDRIVVLIKLNGGNDGLNTIIPVQNSQYYNLRPTIGISPTDALTLNYETGMHPSMNALLPYFQDGEMSVIHEAGYDDGNLSHFRSSDIWATGSDADEFWNTGWLGRLFTEIYPEFPNHNEDHPLAIQMGSANLLEFQTTTSNGASMINDPDVMYQLISENYVPGSNDPPPNTIGGQELTYVRELDASSFEYSEIIFNSANAGSNTVTYPDTNLGAQLAVTAKLISGGLDTPIYRLYLGGFDTHANQLADQGALLQQVSDAVAAFLSDLESQGLHNRVMTMTTSEFGRRSYENGSGGTDHGTSAPIIALGPQINSNQLFHGTHPDLSAVDNVGNPPIQFDFRQVYATLLTDWFGLDASISSEIFQQTFNSIPFIANPLTVKGNGVVPASFTLHPAFPNPFNPAAEIAFDLPKAGSVILKVHSLRGRRIFTHRYGKLNAGTHRFRLNGSDWPAGVYMMSVEAFGSVQSQKITLLK